MFNVGEGEAMVIEFPNERAWVVDCGSGNHPESRNRKLGEGITGYLNERGLKLEALIPSHPHIDHAGGYPWLLQAGPLLAPKVWLFRAADAWDPATGWVSDLNQRLSALASFEEVVLTDSQRVFPIDDETTAHLFAAHGDGAYTSTWLHIRYRDARFLFTGDVHCDYEKLLFELFVGYDFGSELLKITHHGSSSGTSREFVGRVDQGLAFASTAADDGHRLEQDTLDRLGGLGQPRRVFETKVDGDIIVRTDGLGYGDGILYQLEFDPPGRFSGDLGASVFPLADVNLSRTSTNDPDCI